MLWRSLGEAYAKLLIYFLSMLNSSDRLRADNDIGDNENVNTSV